MPSKIAQTLVINFPLPVVCPLLTRSFKLTLDRPMVMVMMMMMMERVTLFRRLAAVIEKCTASVPSAILPRPICFEVVWMVYIAHCCRQRNRCYEGSVNIGQHLHKHRLAIFDSVREGRDCVPVRYQGRYCSTDGRCRFRNSKGV